MSDQDGLGTANLTMQTHHAASRDMHPPSRYSQNVSSLHIVLCKWYVRLTFEKFSKIQAHHAASRDIHPPSKYT